MGEAARVGNKVLVKILLDACVCSSATRKNSQPGCVKRRHSKSHKRKLKSTLCDETVVKCKNLSDRQLKENQIDVSDSLRGQCAEKNQGYFVFIHSEGSSSDEGKVGSCKSPASHPAVSTPQADLEWDEEIVNVAPTTSEDEKWTSMYKSVYPYNITS